MKKVLLLILLSYPLMGQKANPVKDLKSKGNCKTCSAKLYFEADESFFCSTTLFLNSDSTFVYETGCEGRSNLTVGNWTKNGNVYEFEPVNIKKIDLVCNMEFSEQKGSSETVFLFYDKTGTPLNRFNFQAKKQDGAKETIVTNELGCVKINRSDFEKFDFHKLTNLNGKQYILKATNLSDTVKIIINLNVNALHYSEIKYKPIKLKFTLIGNKLVSENVILKLKEE